MDNSKQKRSAISMVFKYLDKQITFKNKLERDLFIREFLKTVNMKPFTEKENTAGYGFTQRNALQVAKRYPQFKQYVEEKVNVT